MKPSAIQVAIDILRELGREEEARWLEHPDAVRALLKDPPGDRNGECPGSLERDDASGDVRGYSCGGGPYYPHDARCPIAAAWRALGDPRGSEDIERAHEEALDNNHRHDHGPSLQEAVDHASDILARSFPFGDHARRATLLHPTPQGRLAQVSALIDKGLLSNEQVRRILDPSDTE